MCSVKTGGTVRGGACTGTVAGAGTVVNASAGTGAVGWLCWWELCLRLRIVLVVRICWISGRGRNIVV
jgi:hypothetical protein